jgi:hypothetical protein
MATTAVMAATLWLLSVPLPLPKTVATVMTSAAMLVLAVMQGFIRADVIFVFHLGILLVCMTRAGDGFSLPRGAQAVTSVLAVLFAGGVQYWLMHVAYPHASYGSTPVFELKLNLTHPLELVPFALFLLPWGWLMTVLARGGSQADAPGLALVAGSAIYLCLWLVVGRMEEVRIFLPYAVALVPLTCVCAMRRLVSVGGMTDS